MRGRWALTPVTAVLLAGNIAVFAVMLVHGAGLWHAPNDVQLAWGANFGPATRDGEWWRLGTAMFVHFGLLHLAVNLWALADCGRIVERLYGHARFLAVYAAGGIAGNLLSLLAHGDRAVSGGASGAIFSAYGALLVWLWRERRQIHPVEFRWLFGGAAAFAAATIGMGFADPGNRQRRAPGRAGLRRARRPRARPADLRAQPGARRRPLGGGGGPVRRRRRAGRGASGARIPLARGAKGARGNPRVPRRRAAHRRALARDR